MFNNITLHSSNAHKNMQEKGVVNRKFILFLKATLGKMVAVGTLSSDFIDLHFWQNWSKKYYNTKAFDSTKTEEKAEVHQEPKGCDEDQDDEESVDEYAATQHSIDLPVYQSQSILTVK